MKKVLILLVCAVMACVVFSCGSSWTIQGNNMTVIKVDRDTIAPAGCYIMLPDSLK